MNRIQTIKDLIDAWPSRKVLAEEIGANVAAVHKWAGSNRIPSDRQSSVVKAAQNKGFRHITGDWMVAMHAAPEPEKHKARASAR